MRSQDVNNIIINKVVNPHQKNQGWEYFPTQQIKQQVEAAQKKEIIKPSPPSIRIKVLELKTQYVDATKPKHIFQKKDLKAINKQKRDDLQQWIKEENNLKKGIQKPIKHKPAPKVKQQEPNDEWPELQEDDQQKYEEQEDEQQQNDEYDEQQQNQEDEENQSNQIKEKSEQNECQNSDLKSSKSQLDQKNSEGEEQQSNQKSEINSQTEQQSQLNSKQSQTLENQSEVKSEVSESFVNNNKSVSVNNKSINTSSILGYKSQVADQMRSLMFDVEEEQE